MIKPFFSRYAYIYLGVMAVITISFLVVGVVDYAQLPYLVFMILAGLVVFMVSVSHHMKRDELLRIAEILVSDSMDLHTLMCVDMLIASARGREPPMRPAAVVEIMMSGEKGQNKKYIAAALDLAILWDAGWIALMSNAIDVHHLRSLTEKKRGALQKTEGGQVLLHHLARTNA